MTQLLQIAMQHAFRGVSFILPAVNYKHQVCTC